MPWTPDAVFPTRSNGDGQVSTCVEFGLSASVTELLIPGSMAASSSACGVADALGP